MKLYLTVIGVAVTVISAVNILFETAPVHYIIIAAVWCTALQFALDGGLAILIKLTPDRFYGADNRFFQVTPKAHKRLARLQVRRWKHLVWELGGIGGFSKKCLLDPKSSEYIEKFIIESNKGIVIHRLSYLVGFLAMLTLNGVPVYTVALPVALVNLFLNILPTLVLRYNIPALKRLLVHNNKITKSKSML